MIDLGKQSFHTHGIRNEGEVISKKVTRSKPEAVVQELAPAIVPMESCARAHHRGRQFEALAYSLRLIHPQSKPAFWSRPSSIDLPVLTISTIPVISHTLGQDPTTELLLRGEGHLLKRHP